MSYLEEVKAKFFNTLTSLYEGVAILSNGSMRTSSQSYLQTIAEGLMAGHQPWAGIGYNGATGTSEATLWPATGMYAFKATAGGLETISANANDVGTSIFSGTATGGSTLTLIDTGKDFTSGTAVAVGDCVILDKSGTTPEWGYVTGVTSNTLAISGGFSSGGSASGRAYIVVDKSATTGAQAIRIEYLTTAFASKSEITLLNGTGAAIATVNTDIYRINSFVVIAAGSGNAAAGNLTLRDVSAGTTRGFITAGYTRSRNIVYTVPAGKALYVTSWTAGYAYAASQTHYARLYTRVNVEPSTGLLTGSLFYPYSEVDCSNNTIVREFELPTRLPAGADLKVDIISDSGGIASTVLRGWLETA